MIVISLRLYYLLYEYSNSLNWLVILVVGSSCNYVVIELQQQTMKTHTSSVLLFLIPLLVLSARALFEDMAGIVDW